MIDWVINLIYLVVVVGTTLGIILAFIVTNVKVAETESNILMNRLQFSPEGIVMYDMETGRVYPGIVDVRKMGASNLESALNIEERDLAARFVLTDLEDEMELATTYLNRDVYDDWQPIAILVAEGDITGLARKFPHEESRYVYAGRAGKLETVVITPNE